MVARDDDEVVLRRARLGDGTEQRHLHAREEDGGDGDGEADEQCGTTHGVGTFLPVDEPLHARGDLCAAVEQGGRGGALPARRAFEDRRETLRVPQRAGAIADHEIVAGGLAVEVDAAADQHEKRVEEEHATRCRPGAARPGRHAGADDRVRARRSRRRPRCRAARTARAATAPSGAGTRPRTAPRGRHTGRCARGGRRRSSPRDAPAAGDRRGGRRGV